MSSELPVRCDTCGHETMVDLEGMESRPLSKLVVAEGFTCKHCGKWKQMFVTTASLMDAMRKLNAMPTARRDYLWYFKKVLRKAVGVQKRGE